LVMDSSSGELSLFGPEPHTVSGRSIPYVAAGKKLRGVPDAGGAGKTGV
jgi:hypothetical protein